VNADVAANREDVTSHEANVDEVNFMLGLQFDLFQY